MADAGAGAETVTVTGMGEGAGSGTDEPRGFARRTRRLAGRVSRAALGGVFDVRAFGGALLARFLPEAFLAGALLARFLPEVFLAAAFLVDRPFVGLLLGFFLTAFNLFVDVRFVAMSASRRSHLIRKTDGGNLVPR